MKEADLNYKFGNSVQNEFNFGNEYHRQKAAKDPNFSYGHYKVNGGVGTVAGFRIGNKVFFGISLCCPNDNFSRAIGRLNARDGLVTADSSNKRGVMIVDDTTKDLHPTELFKLVLEYYLNSNIRKPVWTKFPVVEFRTKAKREKKSK